MATLRVPLYPPEQAAKPAVCCVTGATGYVAGALVQRLLAGGHIVRATCRNPNDASKISHLTSLPDASDRLQLYKADLMDASSFDEPIKGCQYVFHVASPFTLGVTKDKVQEKLVGPAVSGVEAVLEAVSRAGDAEAVVVTSSIVAMLGDNWEHGPDHVLTEADWDTSATASYLPYPYSKTVAERRAWELYEAQKGDKKWRLCTINPGFVLGPCLALSGGESISFCSQMLAGKFRSGLPRVNAAIVDVEDVAAAHVLAALTPSASGRYLCAAEATDLATLVKATEVELGVPPKTYIGMVPPRWLLWVLSNVFRMLPWDTVASSVNKPFKIDTSKIKKDLGIEFIPAAKSLADMAKKIEELQQGKK